MDKATVLKEGTDVVLIACGEMVRPAMDAAEMLKEEGISATARYVLRETVDTRAS